MLDDGSWHGVVRAIHVKHFNDPWQDRLEHINAKYSLFGDDALVTHGRTVPPQWFIGDIEALQPGKWVLVISLNPHVSATWTETRDWYDSQKFTPETYWNHCRLFNSENWYPTFFAPLARLAAAAMGEDLLKEGASRFATDRMLFVELCPYGSHRFSMKQRTVAELALEDVGFRLAADVRRAAIEQGRPALILVNGTATIADLKAVDGDRARLELVRYDSIDQPKPGKPHKRLWHEQGLYAADHGDVPAIGFPFLRSMKTHNSHCELQQLADLIRSFVDRTGGALS